MVHMLTYTYAEMKRVKDEIKGGKKEGGGRERRQKVEARVL